MNVSGAEPLAFQWRFNGVDIPGATASSLTLANVQLANSGAYRVRISNPFGATISDPANLVLQVKPEITLEPQDKIVAPGSTAIFTVSARGTQPLQYQWRFNGNSISGANSFQLVLSNIVAGGYSAIVSNAFGTATSRVATLVINDPPSITTQPEGRTLLAGDTLLLSVSATGTAPLAYQWRKDGIDLTNGGSTSGANLAVLTIAPAGYSDAGNYSVSITNIAGSTSSADAALAVVPAVPVEFRSVERLSESAVRLTLAGNLGARYTIEASSNLTSWSSLVTLTNVAGTVEYTDLTASHPSNLFYRAYVVP